jgi:dienelactone hydrolase
LSFLTLVAAALFATTAQPPQGTADLSVSWMQVRIADHGVILFAIARPSGNGPFPAVVILHGTHGFAREYVQLARAFAREGVIGVAACWFRGGGGSGAGFVTPIACVDAPERSAAASAATQKSLHALVGAVRVLPGVRSDSVALFGHSLGAGSALNYALDTGGITAAVLESGGYTDEQSARASRLGVPILILHGAGDTSADGGSPFQTPQKARGFEAALRAMGKPVAAVYYENAGHNGIFQDPKQFDDSVRQTVAFLSRVKVLRETR